MNSGLVYVFTGEGKGKTSAALGVATRALLIDKKVSWIAFYKQELWGLAEAKLGKHFDNLEMYFGGKGFLISGADGQSIRVSEHQTVSRSVKVAKVGNKGNVVVDTASAEEHQAAATQCLMQAQHALDRKPFLLVMDEVLNAISDGLVSEKGVLELIEKRGDTHLVLTGRHDPSSRMWQNLWQEADLITECKKIKHPYDEGKLAVAGLDF